MSYILDALKKLENEKASKNRGAGMLSISGELFREERRQSSGGNLWKITVVVVAASLATFGVTWFFLKSDMVREGARPPATTRIASIKPVPSQSSPVSAPEPPLVMSPAVPGHPSVKPVMPVVKKALPAAVSHKAKQKNMPKKQPPLVAKQAPPVVTTGASPADIKVSGVAWQDEHNLRRAVVNGYLMHEGGSVSGAKITEIFQDRVRFSRAGAFFDVYLVESGLTGASK